MLNNNDNGNDNDNDNNNNDDNNDNDKTAKTLFFYVKFMTYHHLNKISKKWTNIQEASG